MTYEEVLEMIHKYRRFGSRLGLERMKKFMELHGNPQDGIKYIHIAGTNGKGSVSRYIYSVLQACGYHSGLYTSPYLETFTERIEFDGKQISPDELIETYFETTEVLGELFDQGYESPTEFEFNTGLCFVYFGKVKADIAVLEVGLGGIGDATNIIKDPIMTAITSVSYDHTQQLGNTLPEIAKNKAGIIKPGAPVVSFADDPGAVEVIKKRADEMGVPVLDRSSYKVTDIKRDIMGYSFSAEILGTPYPDVKLAMAGEHQISNACCALTAIEYLRQNGILDLPMEGIYKGMASAVQIGRFEVFKDRDPITVIDGAHNIEGITALVKAVNEHFKDKKLLVLTGILGDKQIDEMTEKLLTLNADFIITEPDNPRSMEAEKLAEKFRVGDHRVDVFPKIKEAWNFLEENKSGYDAVICTGSLHLIGRVRTLLNGGDPMMEHKKEEPGDQVI